jgi:hypothetical protein
MKILQVHGQPTNHALDMMSLSKLMQQTEAKTRIRKRRPILDKNTEFLNAAVMVHCIKYLLSETYNELLVASFMFCLCVYIFRGGGGGGKSLELDFLKSKQLALFTAFHIHFLSLQVRIRTRRTFLSKIPTFKWCSHDPLFKIFFNWQDMINACGLVYVAFVRVHS